MSQLSSKEAPAPPPPHHGSPGAGTFEGVAGFRMGRGRDSEEGNAARQARHPGQQAPYGGAPYGGPGGGGTGGGAPYGPGPAGAPGGAPGHAPGAPGGGWDGRQWQGGPAAGGDEPEYFGGEPSHHRPPQGPGPSYGGQPTYGGPAHGGPGGHPYPGQGQGQGQGYGHGQSQGHGHRPPQPYPQQGSTQQFGLGEAPDAYPPQGGNAPYGTGGYDDGYGEGDAQTYNGPPPGPKLHWKDLLTGLVLRPSATFWRMRDHPMWVPALLVTFVYGLLAVFGFDKARSDVLNATFANSIPLVLIAGVIVLVSGLILGAVTHTLARQLGGDGLWQPTIGLSMLIMSITDAPRLLLAVFLGGDNPVVQLLGWATWLLAGYLFTSMVSKSHDLPWPKALGASAIQLVALLSIIKLGTL
ncbi:YIP1 family protein [Streptomyces mobaraensis]|uniref:YIP1 family protein n=1 Tax=Streptomyces mobaraensis TaxID=35621 RepID=A0A5N5WC95_STRMB|nr:Yip1 family protein [Streptomyces mobaraensis]KAB7848328.1 YIP1 family protein [Streptomyces mobaraensis]